MSKLSPARKLALDVLMEADRRGMYARDVLSSRASAKAIDQRDSAFAARLALGVAATQGILDELLDQFLDKPKKSRASCAHGTSYLCLRDALSAYAGSRCGESGR